MSKRFQDGATVVAACASEHVQDLEAYTPGLQPTGGDWVKLNTNESPYPPAPQVRERILAELGADGYSLRRYPNPTSAAVRAALAKHHGVESNQVLLGNGCDDVLNLLMRVFSDGERVPAMLEPSYSLYRVLSAIQDAEMLRIPVDADFALPVEAICASRANILFLTNPNAPTGVTFSPEAVAGLLERFAGVVVVDETYAPFAGSDCVGLLSAYPQLVVARSFSKAFGLAGMRLGYALADPAVIGLLDRVRDSYNVDRLSQAAALGALEAREYYADVIARTRTTRERVAGALQARGWRMYPSEANFLFVEPQTADGATGQAVAESLFAFFESRRILVRHFPKHALTRGYLRISIGTEPDMETVLEAIEAWLKQTQNA